MTYARIAVALLVMIPQVSQLVVATADPVVIKIVAATARQVEHAEWALTRFEAAGLELPSLTIVFHDDYQSCGMREGVLRIAGEDVTIHECQNDPSRSRRSLLHELAHAWDHVGGSIDADTRTDFLTLRGLRSWDDDDLPWNQRGEDTDSRDHRVGSNAPAGTDPHLGGRPWCSRLRQPGNRIYPPDRDSAAVR